MKRFWNWRSQTWRGRAFQLLALALLIMLVWWLASNTTQNLKARGIQSGFDFLTQPAGFDIGESLLAFSSTDTYWQAYVAGLLNTLRVALLGIVLATLVGLAVGVGRLGGNVLAKGLCTTYVELFRNVPLLLQLLLWYLLFTEVLPAADQAWQLGPVFLSKGGLSYPWLDFQAGVTAWSFPHQGEFAIEGGAALTPEFMALVLGLSLYTAAFAAEVIRAGLQAVPRGQSEAAAVLGLSRSQTLRLVQLPLALRVIIPPMTNQYLNLTKNSSLAVAIGYPDVVSIANTSINQTGRALECISLIMAVYLLLSLTTSALMGLYNRRAALIER